MEINMEIMEANWDDKANQLDRVPKWQEDTKIIMNNL